MKISLPVPVTITDIFEALQRAFLSHSKHTKFFHAVAHNRLSRWRLIGSLNTGSADEQIQVG